MFPPDRITSHPDWIPSEKCWWCGQAASLYLVCPSLNNRELECWYICFTPWCSHRYDRFCMSYGYAALKAWKHE